MENLSPARKELEDYLREVDYTSLNLLHTPTKFTLEFLAFIKLVNGAEGEENSSPVIHMDMLDQITASRNNLFVSFRGSAKTSVLHEYMHLYIGTYGSIPGFGNIDVGIYVSDTIDNGVKSMRQQLEFRHGKSDFLQEYIPEVKFTETRWEFTNIEKKKFCVRGFGASTGVRGFKEYGQRPTWCGLDDLMSDKNAESPTIIKDIRKVVYRAARQAMHPKKRMFNWTGTPFNKKDPLYSAAGSKGWNTRVYPICEKYPCTPEEFVGAWEDRFPYEFVKSEYDKLLADGEIQSFNQELMLKIVSEEDRLIQDSDILWYKRSGVLRNRSAFNFYITTDFATSEEDGADYSVIMVWAYNAHGDWFLIDIVVKRQLMDKNVDDLFRLAQMYKPQQVGIEISGQQKGFIPWIKGEMLTRNIWFTLASDNNGNQEGIRPITKKIQRFNLVVPWFKGKHIYFPEELKNTPEIQETIEEITLATMEGFKSKNDDCGDCISQLPSLTVWKPSMEVKVVRNINDDVWEYDEEEDNSSGIQSYIV
jgi:predicted phage terminase large subunit-like protein